MQRVSTTSLAKLKERREKIVMVTAYDYPSACLVDEAGVDVVLVGDSLGMAVLGHSTTLPVTLDDMLHHTKAVARGVHRALVVTDMPFLSYQTCPEDALRNAGRFLQEGGASAVKLEGGVDYCPQVRALVAAGIPVMGHLGLTPQSVHVLGGYKVQGKTEKAARRLLDNARALEDAGAFGIVLECIPEDVAARISASLQIPTIGIGAGVHCDGQVLVFHDLLGYSGQDVQSRPRPRFVKQYANLSETIRGAVQQYAAEVRQQLYPGREHSFSPEPLEAKTKSVVPAAPYSTLSRK
ncbi:MAG: 3-methyl-2-oxobutanoate hydroxymethyltransferase [Acidobacteria bacterium]|nr:3-methyl-2-oxobutanoate hydroxymethyltransferase [Acidobacteriota bacterium]